MDEAEALHAAAMRAKDVADGVEAPALVAAPRRDPAEYPASKDLFAPDAVVREVKRGRVPDAAPPRGQEAGSGRFFRGQQGEDYAEEAIREAADHVHVAFAPAGETACGRGSDAGAVICPALLCGMLLLH